MNYSHSDLSVISNSKGRYKIIKFIKRILNCQISNKLLVFLSQFSNLSTHSLLNLFVIPLSSTPHMKSELDNG